MPNYYINTAATNISTDDLNTIINFSKNVDRSNSNNELSTLRNLYKTKAAGVNLPETGTVKFSNFREAQVLTACVRGQNEGTTTYSNGNDGKIIVRVCSNTVIGSTTSKIYEYSIVKHGSSRSFVTKSGAAACSCHSLSNINVPDKGQAYCVVVRDGTTKSNICTDVALQLSNASDTVQNCVQGVSQQYLRS